MVRRGDVWLTILDPAVGRELQKTRPCLIVSPDEINRADHAFLAVPMTTGSRPASFRPETMFNGKAGRVLIEQIRTFDRTRFIRKLGRIDDVGLKHTLSALRTIFAD